jgi:tRNA pseudouridine13 synthase
MSDLFSDHGRAPENENPANRDEYGRARAIATWKSTGNTEAALSHLPKRFSAESSIIRHLGRPNQQRDFVGALLTITRGMRMMYIHAYQSYVWNFMASRRWAKHGAEVIVGDLVLTETAKASHKIDDEAIESNQDEEQFYAQARPLTAEDIAAGKYTIFDVVLPTPGYDVVYPRNDIGEYYKIFMSRPENGNLDPYDMRRPQKEFSLSGNYRFLVGRFLKTPEYAIRAYKDDHEQMFPTDLDLVKERKAASMISKAKELQEQQWNPATAAWNHFAQNTEFYDGVIDRERRRKHGEAPLHNGNMRISETWVQTSRDENGKRIKIARHKSESSCGEMMDLDSRSHPPMKSENLSGSTEPSGQGDVNTPSFAIAVQGSSPDAAAGPSFTPAQDDSNVPAATPLGSMYLATLSTTLGTDIVPTTVLTGVERLGEPSTGVKGLSETYYESLLNAKKDVSEDRFVASHELHRSNSPLPPIGWGITERLFKQTLPTKPDASVALNEPKPLGTPTDQPAETKFNCKPQMRMSMTVPQFCSPGDGLGKATLPDVGNTDGESKIAVILKFQLNTSNYATIVLRELMGNVADEEILCGQPTHGQQSHLGNRNFRSFAA